MNISFWGGHNSTQPEDGERAQGLRMPSAERLPGAHGVLTKPHQAAGSPNSSQSLGKAQKSRPRFFTPRKNKNRKQETKSQHACILRADVLLKLLRHTTRVWDQVTDVNILSVGLWANVHPHVGPTCLGGGGKWAGLLVRSPTDCWKTVYPRCAQLLPTSGCLPAVRNIQMWGPGGPTGSTER